MCRNDSRELGCGQLDPSSWHLKYNQGILLLFFCVDFDQTSITAHSPDIDE